MSISCTLGSCVIIFLRRRVLYVCVMTGCLVIGDDRGGGVDVLVVVSVWGFRYMRRMGSKEGR